MATAPYAWAGGLEQKSRIVAAARRRAAHGEAAPPGAGWDHPLDTRSDAYLAYGLGATDPEEASALAGAIFGGRLDLLQVLDWLRLAAPEAAEAAFMLAALEATPPGADLSPAPMRLAVWLLDDPEHGARTRADKAARRAIDAVLGLYAHTLEGRPPGEEAWASARAEAWRAGRPAFRETADALERLSAPWWDLRRYRPLKTAPTARAAEVAKFAAAYGALGGAPFRGSGAPPLLRALSRAYDDIRRRASRSVAVGAYRDPPDDQDAAAAAFVAAARSRVLDLLRAAPRHRDAP